MSGFIIVAIAAGILWYIVLKAIEAEQRKHTYVLNEDPYGPKYRVLTEGQMRISSKVTVPSVTFINTSSQEVMTLKQKEFHQNYTLIKVAYEIDRTEGTEV